MILEIMMKSRLSSALCASIFTLGMIVSMQTASASIVSDFETLDFGTTDGWGGIDGGDYYRAFDILDSSNNHFEYNGWIHDGWVSNSAKFSGDLSAYDGGTFSFDTRFIGVYFDGNGDRIIRGSEHVNFGDIAIVTGVGTFLLPGPGLLDTGPGYDWYNYSVEMSADVWGIDQATWLLGLQSVTHMRIKLGEDSLGFSGAFKYADLDNIRLDAVPIPSAVWLFGSGLIGLIGVARRKKS